jgi:hypothetical protein
MRPFLVRVACYGKQAKYGPDVYKFGAGREAVVLMEAGWRAVRRNPSYWYLSPPPGLPDPRHPTARVLIPDDDEIAELARRLHAEGVEAAGQVGIWRYHYTPHEEGIRITQKSTLGSHGWERSEEPEHFRNVAKFEIGDSRLWHVGFYWDEGPTAEPSRVASGELIPVDEPAGPTAAIGAVIVKPTVTVLLDVEAFVRTIRKHFDPDQAAEIARLILRRLEARPR